MKTHKKILVLGLIVIILFSTALAISIVYKRIIGNNYVIPGVPSFTIFDHTGQGASFTGDTASAIGSVLEYWYPGKYNLQDIDTLFNNYKKSHRLVNNSTIKDFIGQIDKDNLTVQYVNLSLGDLKKYINPETRVPLLLFLPIDESQPQNNTYQPACVLIGINDHARQLTFHSYWLGNNFTLSYDEFNKLESKINSQDRNKYIVIQPTNLNGKINEVKSRKSVSYPARTALMGKTENMFKDYAIGLGARNLGLSDQSQTYYQKIEADPNFEQYFPGTFKVWLYINLANLAMKKNDLDQALDLANKAVELDVNLDKPSGDWPGYSISAEWNSNRPDELSEPYRIQGDAYLALGNQAEAKKSYQAALDIRPSDSLAQVGLIKSRITKQ